MNKEPDSFFDRLNLNLSGVAVSTLTWTLPALTPLFMGLQILAPLPAFFYLTEAGRKHGINTIAVALMVSGIITLGTGNLEGLVFTLLMLPAGVSLARGTLRLERDPVRAGFRACLVLLLGWLIWALFYGLTQNNVHGLYQEIKTSMDSGLVEVGRSLKDSTQLTPEQALDVETTIKGLRRFMPRVLPGMLLVTLLNTVFLNMVCGQWLLRRKKPELAPWPPLARWRLPEPLVTLVILGGFSLLLPIHLLQTTGYNLLLVAGTLYFFQGVAILAHFLERWAVPPLLRVLIYLLMFIQAYGLVLLAVAGLVDVWFDLRKPRPKADKEDN